MKRVIKITALLLTLALLLSGCSMAEFSAKMEALRGQILGDFGIDQEDYPSFQEMQYVRPNMIKLLSSADTVLESAKTATDVEALMEDVNAFFDAYMWFYTYYNLANIYYCIDMTDPYWQAEYNYCTEQYPTADAAREEILYTLAKSPLREELEQDHYFGADYFDAYDGQSVYDDVFMSLMNEESAILNRYYQVSAEAASVEYGSEEYYTTYGTQLAEILVELIAVRQKQATHCGYDSYPDFAYNFYHGRDFTPDQAETYMQAVAEELMPLYRQVNTQFGWDATYELSSESATFDYVKKTAEAMGGDIATGFYYLEEDQLYHISPGENKFNASFEVYLPGYNQPFIFLNPLRNATDKLAFVHEFGHYMADYYTWGSGAGTDVAEVQSQAMEYLSLIYAEADQKLVDHKLADSLCIYVEQSAYALFEQEMYNLKGPKLSVESLQALYERIGTSFGFDSWSWDSRDFVTVSHYYSYPMYIISYVVSNDLALQIYQQELETSGAGLAAYEEILSSDMWYIMEFAETYGLENPLDPARLEEVEQLLATVLAD